MANKNSRFSSQTGQSNIYRGDAVTILGNLLDEGIQVDHVVCDPPYNISKPNNFATMSSSTRQGVDFGNWDKGFDLVSWVDKAVALLKPGGTFIVFNSYRNFTPIILAMEEAGLVVKDILRWTKSNPMPRNVKRRYVQDTEFAIWAVKPGKPWVFHLPKDVPYLRAAFTSSTVSGKERTAHPTQKSLKLMKELIGIHTRTGDLILDPFMGSGTTGVAALELERKFIGIEIDKKYYEIAQERLGGE